MTTNERRQAAWTTALLAMLACTSGCEVYDEPLPQAAQSPAGANESQQVQSEGLLADLATLQPVAPGGHHDLPDLGRPEPSPASQPFVHSSTAGGLQFVEGLQNGLTAAQRDGRPMLVFFTASWCHYCKEMAANAFYDPEVVELGRHFVCVAVDADAAPELCQQLRVRAFPTVQFVSPRGVPLNRLEGKKSARQLAREMHAALRAIAERSSPDTTHR